MKFFLDENFPLKAKEILEAKKHSIFDIRGTGKEGISDEKIFQISKKKKAVFLTTDKDFFHTIHFMHKPHYGVIVIALSVSVS